LSADFADIHALDFMGDITQKVVEVFEVASWVICVICGLNCGVKD